MMKQLKRIILVLSVIISTINIVAQSLSDTQLKNLNPLSPTAFQFIKYGEIPVSEYTGSPTIEIPLYNIEIRGLSLPLKLQYHSKGVRVSEEADWVGLGWDLGFGSITQIVHGKDDLNKNYIKKCIPYYESKMPSTYSYWATTPPTYTDMFIDNSRKDYYNDDTYSFVRFIHNMGGYDGWNVTTLIDFENTDQYDFEKDIFIANVLGEQLYILIKPVFNASGLIITGTTYTVLNKKGYQVSIQQPTIANKTWKIVTPSGITCFFEERNETNNSSTTYTDAGGFSDENTDLSNSTNQTGEYNYNNANGFLYSSCVWQISKIISIYGDVINFNYTSLKPLISVNKSYTWKVGTGTSQRMCGRLNGVLACGVGPFLGTVPIYMRDGDINKFVLNGSVTSQNRSYLSSITYNNNTINFNTSARSDWSNSQQLDNITVINSLQQPIKTIQFNYDYFQSSCTGRGYTSFNPTKMCNRLRLNWITQNGELYNFTYNSTPLPPKNSFGVDYWGYYNGKTDNKSPFPNPVDFKDRVSYDTSKDLLYNNLCGILYAVSNYCKAGVLEKIQYPTGGFSRFSYSLNCFDNYKVPNDPTISNTSLYYGNGLKIDSIINYTEDGKVATIKHYQYENGKLQTPLHFFLRKVENYSSWGKFGSESDIVYNFYAYLFNIFTNNYYSPNPTGDGTGVGYDKVSSWVINKNTGTTENGKEVHFYVNNPDVLCFLSSTELIEEVPSYHKGFNNGTLLREELYDNSNQIKIGTNFKYSLSFNPTIEYNSRVTPLGFWDGMNIYYDIHKDVSVSYYPLFKPETLLTSKDKAEYYNNDSIVTSEGFSYSNDNILSGKSISCSFVSQQTSERYCFPSEIYNNSNYSQAQRDIMQKLILQNRLSETIKVMSSKYTRGAGSIKNQYFEYDADKLLPNNVKTSFDNNSLQTQMRYIYDTNKNIVEKIDKDNVSTSYLWGYNGNYIIACIKNATYIQITTALSTLGTNPTDIASTAIPDMTKVDALRATPSLISSFITTYTYKPLVGMTSMTDPRGIITNYTYDNLNRLYNINDNNNYILQQYQYHNKGQ